MLLMSRATLPWLAALALFSLTTREASVVADDTISLPVSQPNAAALLDRLTEVRRLRDDGVPGPVTLVLPAGTYRLQSPLELDAGIVGDGLTLRAESVGDVIISGARLPLPPQRDGNGRWRYQLPRNWKATVAPRELLINGQLHSAARHPNQGYLRIERALEDRRSGFVVNAGDLPHPLDLSAGRCDLVLLHDWSSSRLPVASFDSESRELRTLGPIGCKADHYAIDHFEKQPRYWLEGHPAFADQPGEWYFDRSTSEIVVIGDERENEAPQVELPALTQLLVARGTDESPLRRLSLEGLVFTGTRFPMPPGGVATGQATTHEVRDESGDRVTSGRTMLDAAVHIETAESCVVKQCQFREVGGTALWLGSRVHRSQVVAGRFDNIGGNGVNIGEDTSRRIDRKSWYHSAPEQVPTDNRITRCEISHVGRIMPGAVAIWGAFNRSLEIDENHIHDVPYTGISLGWMWNDSATPATANHIHDNHIEYVMQVLSDGGGIYTLGRQPETVIEGNTISDISRNAGRAESNGMFLDQGSAGLTIRNNTIRRVERSPLRFHQAGENLVVGNRWELAPTDTPPVRYNNTPEANITLKENEVIERKASVFLIGNSLTWDTIPSKLDGYVRWHVDCGKSLPYITAHPEHPCVSTSRLWPEALTTAEYDFVTVQPHYGSTLMEDADVISDWVALQPNAVFILHTGWARHEKLVDEYGDQDPAGPLTHSPAYIAALKAELSRRFPDCEFRQTMCTELLHQVQRDIEAGQAPLNELSELYRDAIHMTTSGGRYLMHNAMRAALGQVKREEGFPEFAPELKNYLDGLLAPLFAESAGQ